MWDKLKAYLFTPIDNSALVVFRIIFGFLITCEAWGAIATGWVRRVFVTPEFTFNFIGLDFLQSFPGTGPHMYAWFAVMGLMGVFVMLGYRYKFAMFTYAILWTVVYFMQKSAYNNHYYLMVLLCWLFAFLPAHRAVSLDVKYQRVKANNVMPRGVFVLIIAQLFVVYTYGSIAKMYPDWLDATVPELFMRGKKDYWLIGDFLQHKWVHWAIAYFGIAFDGLVIPALLFKPTRKVAFIASIFFHLFNSVVFQVGVFPYMSLGFLVFFFEPELIRKLFLKNHKKVFLITKSFSDGFKGKYNRIPLYFAMVYLLVQIVLPLRHLVIPGDVLWTEEGHRMSWRMMLRSKSGTIHFRVVDSNTSEKIKFNHREYLSIKQRRAIVTKPDVIWQFAQRVKAKFKNEGKNVSVYADAYVGVNGRKLKRLIDPKIDLGNTPWNYFGHNSWILESSFD